MANSRAPTTGLSQAVNEFRQTAFQVGGFVPVNATALGQFVDHADHLRQKLTCLFLVFQIAQVFDCRTSRLLVVTVLQATLRILANAL